MRSALVAIITLPIAIILSFVSQFAWANLEHHVLGGIAIAIGAMIDAAIIMVENGHKALQHFRGEHNRDPDPGERTALLIWTSHNQTERQRAASSHQRGSRNPLPPEPLAFCLAYSA